MANRQVDLSIFFYKIPNGLYKDRHFFRYRHGHILFFCIAKGELLYSPGSSKHLKLANFGQIAKIGQLELRISLDPNLLE